MKVNNNSIATETERKIERNLYFPYRDMVFDAPRRQANQISADKGEQYQKSPENVIGNVLSASNSRSASPMPQVSVTPPPASPIQTTCAIPPTPPAPPPPPTMNAGSIPVFRLKSEIPEKCNEPPAKIQSAMTKDKKPFTYAPGGIDFSEIKSPRMKRRLEQNAQEPEDIVLPPTSTASNNAHSLPPSAAAAMMPQIAVAVFPQFNPLEKQIGHNRNHNTNDGHVVPPPPTPSQSILKTTPTARPLTPTLPTQTASNLVPILPENSSRSRSISPPPPPQKHASTSQKVPHGSLYIPPPATNIDNRKSQSPPATFPTLREAPTPWLQKQQQPPQPEVIPSWVHRDNYTGHDTASEESKINQNEVGKVLNGTRIIPVQIEGSYQTQPNSRGPSPRWGTSNETVIHPTTRVQKQTETDPKSMPGRSFNAIQKGIGADNDFDVNTTTYHTEGIPLSQLRKLNLSDNDQTFLNNFKAQGGNNVIVIPISGATTNYHPQNSNNNTRNLISPTTQNMQNRTADKMIAATYDIETKKNYIPPSERQAEQELQKYMGSSIPSRSFKMLQAMTAADELSDRKDCTDF